MECITSETSAEASCSIWRATAPLKAIRFKATRKITPWLNRYLYVFAPTLWPVLIHITYASGSSRNKRCQGPPRTLTPFSPTTRATMAMDFLLLSRYAGSASVFPFACWLTQTWTECARTSPLYQESVPPRSWSSRERHVYVRIRRLSNLFLLI
jgi:hypothetical protein